MTLNRKKITLAVLALLAIFLTWYLFIKENDYEINFKAKTASATVYQGILDWAKSREKTENEKFTVTEKKQFTRLRQTMTSGQSVVEYNWTIKSINDTITTVKVGINNKNNKIWNRLLAPFGSKFTTNEIEKIKTFKSGLEEHLSNFKIGKVMEGSTADVFVAYITLETVMQEKAQIMMGSDNIIVGYLHKNKIPIVGKPICEVLKLDLETEKMTFNYCFPIDINTKYITDKNVKFKTITAKKGLKIDYFGNYRTSDRAWFKVIDYAKKQNIDLDMKPIENYLSNPFDGGYESEWKTTIVIPFKKLQGN